MTKMQIIEHSYAQQSFLRPLVTRPRKPLELEDEDYFYTNGLYSVEVRPFPKTYLRKCDHNKFLIKLDFLQARYARVGSWEEFANGKNEVFNWLIENTNVSKRLFDLAEKNLLVDIPFALDFEKYCVGRSDKLKIGKGFERI